MTRASLNCHDQPIPVRRTERLNLEALTGPPESKVSSLAGTIPTEGIYSAAKWAETFEVDERTFRRWVLKYDVTSIRPGDRVYVDAEELIPKLPRILAAEVRRSRGEVA